MNRFWNKVNIPSLSDCWEWQAGKFRKGYGQFWLNNRQRGAHRVSYEMHYGEIPKGLYVLHTCDNPPCVNPLHLFLGTRQDNVDDMTKKGRHSQAKKTHCASGHPLSGNNLYPDPRGYRGCKACRKVSKQAFEAKRKTNGI